jgi:6,7-dimethyl-8-ribityllumazine synthase
VKELQGELYGAGLTIGIVWARFNEPLVRTALHACVERLRELGVTPDSLWVLRVPGALEIPLALQRLAASGRFSALIALGAVIRGETYHFDVVSNESAAGIAQVQLDSGVPIANGVLTANTDEQANVRAAPKGRDCAEAAVEMASLLGKLPQSLR